MSLSLVPWLQRAAEASQCVAGLDFLHRHLERLLHGLMKMKPGLQARPEDVEDARTMRQLPRKAEGTE